MFASLMEASTELSAAWLLNELLAVATRDYGDSIEKLVVCNSCYWGVGTKRGMCSLVLGSCQWRTYWSSQRVCDLKENSGR